MAVDLPDEAQEKLNGVVVRIFDECSFQDIIGQRITMVLRTRKVIASIADMSFRHPVTNSTQNWMRREDGKKLLDGPQEKKAASQDDMDEIFANPY